MPALNMYTPMIGNTTSKMMTTDIIMEDAGRDQPCGLLGLPDELKLHIVSYVSPLHWFASSNTNLLKA